MNPERRVHMYPPGGSYMNPGWVHNLGSSFVARGCVSATNCESLTQRTQQGPTSGVAGAKETQNSSCEFKWADGSFRKHLNELIRVEILRRRYIWIHMYLSGFIAGFLVGLVLDSHLEFFRDFSQTHRFRIRFSSKIQEIAKLTARDSKSEKMQP